MTDLGKLLGMSLVAITLVAALSSFDRTGPQCTQMTQIEPSRLMFTLGPLNMTFAEGVIALLC